MFSQTQEDIITKLIEFLEKPHVKSDVAANEKDKVFGC